MPVRSADKWIALIGIFKLVKGVLLLAAGIGVLKLLHKNVAEVASIGLMCFVSIQIIAIFTL